MRARQIVAAALVATLATMTGGGSATLWAQKGNVTLAGTAKDEAKKPYPDYSTRARELEQGQVVGTRQLDESGNFSLNSLQPDKYIVELLDKNGKVVCTEGPFDMTRQPIKDDVRIDCDKVPAAWWLLGAAAAAGITAGVVTGGPASPAQ